MGDFNYSGINWEGNSGVSGDHHEAKFLMACEDGFLIQHQKEPTQFREGQRPTMPDLILTNRDDMVTDLSTLPGLGKSDHSVILAKIACSPFTKKARRCYNFKRADFNKMNHLFSLTDWEALLHGLSVDDAWNVFENKVTSVVDECVPLVLTSSGRRKTWMDGGTLNSVRNKYKLHRKWLKSKSGIDYLNYKKARNRAIKAIRKAKRRLEASVAADSKKNPKAFWAYVNSKTKVRSGVCKLRKADGSEACSDIDKAEELNSFFYVRAGF